MSAAVAKLLAERFGPAVAEFYRAQVLPDLPKIVTTYDPPPIPLRGCDWSAVTVDYDYDSPIGFGGTEQDAVMDLLDQLEARA